MNHRVLLMLIGFFACLSIRAEEPAVRVAWDDYPPYQMTDTGPTRGIDMDIIDTILTKAGYRVSFVKMPWARQLQSLAVGELDIAMSASISGDRARYVAWSTGYRRERAALMAIHTPNPPITALKDLIGSDRKVALIRDSSYPGEFAWLLTQAEFRALLEYTPQSINSLRMLQAGRVAFILDDPVVIEFLGRQSNGTRPVIVLDVLNTAAHFMVSRKRLERLPALMGEIDTGIEQLTKDGTVRKVFEQYGTTP